MDSIEKGEALITSPYTCAQHVLPLTPLSAYTLVF